MDISFKDDVTVILLPCVSFVMSKYMFQSGCVAFLLFYTAHKLFYCVLDNWHILYSARLDYSRLQVAPYKRDCVSEVFLIGHCHEICGITNHIITRFRQHDDSFTRVLCAGSFTRFRAKYILLEKRLKVLSSKMDPAEIRLIR
jgi:hypothetical protein